MHNLDFNVGLAPVVMFTFADVCEVRKFKKGLFLFPLLQTSGEIHDRKKRFDGKQNHKLGWLGVIYSVLYGQSRKKKSSEMAQNFELCWRIREQPTHDTFDYSERS